VRLDNIKKRMAPNGVIIEECVWGYSSHMISASASPAAGAIVNPREFAVVGVTRCLTKSLIASANGWGRPIIPTFLGPFRSWA